MNNVLYVSLTTAAAIAPIWVSYAAFSSSRATTTESLLSPIKPVIVIYKIAKKSTVSQDCNYRNLAIEKTLTALQNAYALVWCL